MSKAIPSCTEEYYGTNEVLFGEWENTRTTEDLLFSDEEDEVPSTDSYRPVGDTPDRLRWRREVGNPKERRYVRVAGVAPDIEIVPFINSLDTLLRAVVERVFLVKSKNGGFSAPPRPAPGVFSSRLTEVRRRLVETQPGEVRPYLPSTAPCSHQQFVDGYSGRKKVAYQRALDDLRAGRGSLEEDASIKVFIKYEKTDRTTKTDPVPRVISPRHPRYNIRVGRFLNHRFEKKVFKALGKLFHPTEPAVIKGLNAEEAARVLRRKWEAFTDPVAVGLDASRFDQHVSREALEWEHEIYTACFTGKHRERLAHLLSYQLVNRCSGETPDGRVKYTINGTRMSGDMNTSLGNCVLMCAMIRAYLDHKGVAGLLANNGDDCVVFMERSSLGTFMDGLDKWFEEMGFNMAVEPPVDEFEALEFCQTHPVFDGECYVMCRNPITGITKDSVMLKCYDSPAFFKGWLDAVGTGGLALTGGLPIFQELYRAYQRSGQKRVVPENLLSWSNTYGKQGMNRAPGIVRPEARASFYTAFGVTPDEQIELEKYYSKLKIRAQAVPYRPRGIFE